MKQFLITLSAVLIGGFLALLGYDHFVVKPREAAAAKTEAAARRAEATPVDLSQAREDARDVAAELESSVRRSVDSAEEAMRAQAKAMDRASLARDAVSRATMFRVAMTEYYQTNGAWPRTAEDAGLPPPEDTRGPAVASIAIGDAGAVVVRLDRALAENTSIVLRPEPKSAMGMVDWRCELKGDVTLKAFLPRCVTVQ